MHMGDNQDDLYNIRLVIMEIVADCTQIHAVVGWPNPEGVWKITFSKPINHDEIRCIDYMVAGLNLSVNTTIFNIRAPTFLFLIQHTRQSIQKSTPRGKREIDRGTSQWTRKTKKRDEQ